MSNAMSSVLLQYFQRNAPSLGPTSSADQNAMMNEIAHDLAALASAINVSLLNMVSTLPDGTADPNVNAVDNGLDATTIYSNTRSSSLFDAANFNSTAGRPYTIYETMANMSATISALQVQIQNQFADLTADASSINIQDGAGLYNSANVEDALTEVMAKVNLLQTLI